MELLLKYHQGIKAEINTRAKNFSTCLELGESLLQRQHQASEEVSPSMSLSPCLLSRKLQGVGRRGCFQGTKVPTGQRLEPYSVSPALRRWVLTKRGTHMCLDVGVVNPTSQVRHLQVPRKDESRTVFEDQACSSKLSVTASDSREHSQNPDFYPFLLSTDPGEIAASDVQEAGDE